MGINLKIHNRKNERKNKMIKLELDVEDVNLILGLLSQQPFGEVYKLINNIHSQAKSEIEREQLEEKETK